MAIKKTFTDLSLATLVDEIKSYTNNAVSTKANSSHTHSIANITNLQSTLDDKADSSHNHNASNINAGTLSSDRLPTVPVAKGGTGSTTAAGALTNLGITATASELNKLDGVTATTTELNYVDGVTSNIQAQLDGKLSISGTAASAEKLSTRYNQRGYTGASNTYWYYPVATLPIDSSGNYSSIIVNGRVGGWTNSNISKLDLVLTNRSDYTGNTITASGSIKGQCSNALSICDIVVYKQDNLSAIAYIKVGGYFTFDVTLDFLQATSAYTGSYITTPTGTLIWSISNSSAIIRVDTSGVITGSLSGNATSATKATQDGNGKTISSTYETKADATSKLSSAKTYADSAATTAATNVKNELLNGAGAAYDTLKELGDLINDNVDAIDALEVVAVNKADKNHTHAGTGDYSTFIGANTTVSGNQSTALGQGANIANVNVTAVGQGVTATSDNVTALGQASIASGANTISIGQASEASGEYSISIGQTAKATGDYSVAIGQATQATSDYTTLVGQYVSGGVSSVVVGQGANTTKGYSVIIGQGANASADCATVIGQSASANGVKGIAIGHGTVAAGDFATAIGSTAQASGSYAYSLGTGTLASSGYQTVVGRYNIEDNNNVSTFIVGNGSEKSRSNVHTIGIDGSAWYQGDVYVGSTSGTNRDAGSKKLVTEDYVNALLEAFETRLNSLENRKPTVYTTISLPASAWVGSIAPYSQVVSIPSATANTRVDLDPTVAQIVEMQNSDTAFKAENDNGVITVYSINNKPETDYTMQASLTEVTFV